MSKLLAVQCGTLQMLQVRGDFDMDRIEMALALQEPVTVHAYVPELDEVRALTIENLTRRRDGWGVEHITGYIFEGNNMVYATLHDNPVEANPLNLK